jgi:hypothetical protein
MCTAKVVDIERFSESATPNTDSVRPFLEFALTRSYDFVKQRSQHSCETKHPRLHTSEPALAAFRKISPIKFCMHLFSLPFVLHVQPLITFISLY